MRLARYRTHSLFGTLHSIPAPNQTWCDCIYASQTLAMGFLYCSQPFFSHKQGFLLNVELANSWPGGPVSSGDPPRDLPSLDAGEHNCVCVLLLWFGLVW